MTDADGWSHDPQPDHVVMSWFGSLLVSDANTDWIRHLPWAQIEPTSNYLLVRKPGIVGNTAIRLTKRLTRPRALPLFTSEPSGDGRYTLRCTDSGTGDARPGHLMAAIPDGRVEIDRLTTSTWEQFLIVRPSDRARLEAFLAGGMTVATDGTRTKITLDEGHVLSSGEHRIDLAKAIQDPDGLSRTSFRTMAGHDIEIITG